jgi:REP element-mobilizing transposase RayT
MKKSNSSKNQKQFSFEGIKSKTISHGGILRRKRNGRGVRPLSTKDPLHVVFKINRNFLKSKSLRSVKIIGLINYLILRYSKTFFIKIDQLSIQNDHIHLLIRTSRRSLYHSFFRVLAGQISQSIQKSDQVLSVTDSQKIALWMYRPFSRVVRGWRSYKTVRNYIQLNEKEVLKEIKYRKSRLRGLTEEDWIKLWK